MYNTQMNWVIAGLGNPGGEYEHTRHNAGRVVLEEFRITQDLPQFEYKRANDALMSRGSVFGANVILVEPETFMNDSGKSLTTLVKNVKQAARLIVIYDDIDLPLGTWRISFDRSAGGHNGVASIARSLKTKAFVRIRIGITPATLAGKPKKPKGDDEVIKFLMSKFTAVELKTLLSLGNELGKGIEMIMKEDYERAMNTFN